MKKHEVIGASVLTLLLLASAPASAGHVTGACAYELNNVEQAIIDATFLGKRAADDESNMLAKLEAAVAKRDMEKFDDAVDKLLDISDKATNLAGAGKPKLDSAEGINTAVTNAITCVGGLGV